MRLTRRWAPEQIVSAATIGALLAALCVLWLAVSMRSPGVVLTADGDVARVAAISAPPAATQGLRIGDSVTAIDTSNARAIVRGSDFLAEPDTAFNTVVEYRRFLQRQGRIAATLDAPSLVLVRADGQQIRLPLRDHRPLQELPWAFWLQLVCGILGVMTGAAVFAYRQTDPAARYYALTGLGLAVSALAAAVYSTREMALPLALFDNLRALNQAGALFYTAGFVSVLWHYPKPVGRFALPRLLFAVYGALAIASWQYWLPTIDLAMRLPVLAGFLTAIGLGVYQWRRSRGEPLDRAGLRWFLFSWFIGSGLFLGLVFVPPLFDINSSQAQAPAFVLLLVVHLSLAVGILRYGLFMLDRWWLSVWLLMFSLVLIYGLNLALLYALGLTAPIALAVSLAMVGWLYFPVRNRLYNWLNRTPSRSQPLLIQMVTGALARPDQAPDRAWQALLAQVFEPREMTLAAARSYDRLAEGGLALFADNPAAGSAVQLRYCRQGRRLFNGTDLVMLRDLRALFDEVLRYRRRLEEAVHSERDRVARDLHDDVGARLLTLSHGLTGNSALQARQALTDLREVVYSMRRGPAPFADLLGDWRGEAAERCDNARVELVWTLEDDPPEHTLGGAQALALSRIYRETLSNALHHGAGAPIEIRLCWQGSELRVCVAHAHAGAPPQQWRASLGLQNLRDRVARMGGHIDWSIDAGRLTCAWTVDLAGYVERG